MIKRFGAGLNLETETGELWDARENMILLTPTESRVMAELMSRKRQAYTAKYLVSELWGAGCTMGTPRIMVMRVRKKLSESNIAYDIDSLRGFGWRIVRKDGDEIPAEERERVMYDKTKKRWVVDADQNE